MQRKWIATLTFMLVLGTANTLYAQAMTGIAVSQKLMLSTARVETEEGSSGTAWIVDFQRKLLITNHHVVASKSGVHDHVWVLFPVYVNGRLVAEKDYYISHSAQLRASGHLIGARVIDFNVDTDLALLQVDSLPPGSEAVKLAANSASPNETLLSIGNPPADAYWLNTSGSVKQVFKRKFPMICEPDQYYHRNAMVIMIQSPINPGDSGGPVVNDRCELVGVSDCITPGQSLLNYAIDVSEVHKFMAESGWMASVRTAEDYNRRAMRYVETGRFKLALADSKEATEQASLEAKYRLDNTVILQAMSRAIRPTLLDSAADRELRENEAKNYLNAAMSGCNLAVLFDSKNAMAFVRRGDVLVQMKAGSLLVVPVEEAVKDYTHAIELDPTCAQAYHSLARYYRMLDMKKSFECFEKAIRLSPNDVALYSERADLHRCNRDYPKAMADLNMAIHLAPEKPELFVALAEIHESLSEHQLAINALQVATQLQPENPNTWRKLAQIAAACHDFKGAVACFANGIQFTKMLHNKDAEHSILRCLHLERGDAEVAIGNIDEARNDYRVALKLADSTGEKETIREKIRKLPSNEE